MPRLFTGLELPADVIEELAVLRGGIPGARWIDPENYHLTLRFIGDIDGGLAREIAGGLAEIRTAPFEISLKGVGYFGNRKPRNVWVGVAPKEPVSALQQSHERLCQRLGLEPEGRKYSPHITIARLRNGSRREVETWVSRHSLFETRPFEVSRFVLFSSRPSKGGGPYVVEQGYDLAAR